MKVLRNMLNDNNSEIKEMGGKWKSSPTKSHENVSPEMSFKVMNRLLSVISRLIIREATLLFPAGDHLKKNSNKAQLFTIMYKKTVLVEIFWQLTICPNSLHDDFCNDTYIQS